MYSRYVPGSNGSYERKPLQPKPPPPRRPPPAKEVPCQPEGVPCPPPKEPCCPKDKASKKLPAFLDKLLPKDMEIGDLLVLLILVLVLLDGEEDSLSILLAIGLFFFMK